MDEYITKEQARDILARHYPYANLREETAMHHVNEEIKALPAADVVEVVRCRECAHRPKRLEGSERGFGLEFPDERCPCQCEDGWYSWMPGDDYFCGNGERKDGADNA